MWPRVRKSSAALGFGFELVTSGERLRSIMALLFQINEDMVQILLVMEVLSTQDSKVEDLLCGASSGFNPSLFFSNYLFGFKPIQERFQHDFARVIVETDGSVILENM